MDVAVLLRSAKRLLPDDLWPLLMLNNQESLPSWTLTVNLLHLLVLRTANSCLLLFWHCNNDTARPCNSWLP